MKYQVIEVIWKFINQISSGTPSGTSTGQIWFDSVANKFRWQKSASIVDLEWGSWSAPVYVAQSTDWTIWEGNFYGVTCSTWNITLTLTNWTTSWVSLTVKKLDATPYQVIINGLMDWDTQIILTLEDESIDLYWNWTVYLIN